MINPTKNIRTAYFTLLSTLGYPVYDKKVPIDKQITGIRILLSTQTKQIDGSNKCGHGWLCTILLDVINEVDGFSADRAVIDDIEEQILTLIDTWTWNKTFIDISPFTVYSTRFVESHDMDLDTPTKSIIRQLIRFEHRLDNVSYEDTFLVTSGGDFLVTSGGDNLIFN